uniref:TCTA protein n=1 Tax=Coturnix japonica TaxID=93934 RepID=A0A8C2TE84_COTJA
PCSPLHGQALQGVKALGALGRELAAEWATQDVRVALVQLLLLWLGLSLTAIRLAWRSYGEEVAALCYRPPGAPTAPAEPGKTHRE